MQSVVSLYSVVPGELEKFLSNFFGTKDFDKTNFSDKQWTKEYPNPVEIVDMIGVYVENIDEFNISMWVSFDSGVFIKVTVDNADELVRYLYERFPY